MPLQDSYAVWNNKGGVGKSTITFHLASRYAESHPDTNVLVIDLCPQANSSMILLGGGTKGEQELIDRCQEEDPRTVVGYLATVISAGPGAPLPDSSEWLVRVNRINAEVPENVFLLCGDGNLEPMAPLIADRAAQPALSASSDPWKWVHEVIRSFITRLSNSDKNWVVFIDTNPSFSIYTEVAICGASKLVVPVNADDSSRVAVNALFTLLHGSNPPHPVYGKYTFAAKAAERKMKLPKIQLIVGNRVTVYGGPATAFKAMSDATAAALFEAFQANPDRFTAPHLQVGSLDDFQKAYSEPLRDFNSAGVVAAHLGKPISRLKEGHHPVHGDTVHLDRTRINDCLEAVDRVLERLAPAETEAAGVVVA